MATRLRSRMIRSGLVLVVAILAVAGLTSGILFAKEVRADARLRLTGQAETMIISLTDRLIEQGQLTTADVERLAPTGTEVVLRNSSGEVVARTGPVLAERVMSVDVQRPRRPLGDGVGRHGARSIIACARRGTRSSASRSALPRWRPWRQCCRLVNSPDHWIVLPGRRCRSEPVTPGSSHPAAVWWRSTQSPRRSRTAVSGCRT